MSDKTPQNNINDKAEQAKKLAAEKLEQVKNMSADEAKKLAKEKAEQAKKIAAEKMAQMKNMSADEAKAMAEEKMKKFNAMPMINKVSYGAAAAAVVLGLFFTFSGGESSSGSSSSSASSHETSASTEEWELFAYDGKCEEGELVEEKQDRSRTLFCKLEAGTTATILREDFLSNGKVRSVVAYDLFFEEDSAQLRQQKSFEKNYNASGQMTSSEQYVNKLDGSGKPVSALLTEKNEIYTNGKPHNKTTFAINQNEDGSWTSRQKQSISWFSNGKKDSEHNYEVKQNKSGNWVSLQKNSISFTESGKKKMEYIYGSIQNKDGEWKGGVEKSVNYGRYPLVITRVLKEAGSGSVSSYKVSEISVDWKETDENGKKVLYKVLQNDDASWKSLEEKDLHTSHGTTNYREYIIMKDKAGNYKNLEKLTQQYKFKNNKKILENSIDYEVATDDTDQTDAFAIKSDYYNNGVNRGKQTNVILKDAEGRNHPYISMDKTYGPKGNLKVHTKYVNKKNNDGSWENFELEKIEYKRDKNQYTKEVKSHKKYAFVKGENGKWTYIMEKRGHRKYESII